MCSPAVHVPFGSSTEGARHSSRPARHQGGSSSVALLLVEERIVCAVVAAPVPLWRRQLHLLRPR